jgi:hypothetical protein
MLPSRRHCRRFSAGATDLSSPSGRLSASPVEERGRTRWIPRSARCRRSATGRVGRRTPAVDMNERRDSASLTSQPEAGAERQPLAALAHGGSAARTSPVRHGWFPRRAELPRQADACGRPRTRPPVPPPRPGALRGNQVRPRRSIRRAIIDYRRRPSPNHRRAAPMKADASLRQHPPSPRIIFRGPLVLSVNACILTPRSRPRRVPPRGRLGSIVRPGGGLPGHSIGPSIDGAEFGATGRLLYRLSKSVS